jgi:RNA polymerase sigma-70 factor (ECF subfamily)
LLTGEVAEPFLSSGVYAVVHVSGATGAREAEGATVIAISRRRPPQGGAAPSFEDALAHADGLYNLARYLTRSAADAEDLVQETYARGLRAWEMRDANASLAAWLFRILRNAWLDRKRRDRRSPLDNDAGEDPGEAVLVADSWFRNDVELEQMRGLVSEEIEAALGTLSDDARTVVLLDVEGFTESEMAHVLGCAVGTVKSRLSRARAALRARLADYAHLMGKRS